MKSSKPQSGGDVEAFAKKATAEALAGMRRDPRKPLPAASSALPNWQFNLRRPSMTAAAVPAPPSAQPAQQAQSPAPAPAPAQAGGGGNNNGNQSSSGGGGSNGNQPKGLQKLSLPALILVAVCSMLLFAVLGIAVNIGVVQATHRWITPVQMEQMELQEKMSKMQSQSEATPKVSTEDLRTFDCSTLELREQVFAQEKAYILKPNTRYRLASGCAVVELESRISSFSGEQYLLDQVDSTTSTGFRGCGTIGGRNDRSSECEVFLNTRRGQKVRVTIKNGGYITIN